MDPLALLCNLHGDGPSTLHRLRRSGCETLSGLEEWDADRLAPILAWEAARTERFLREARHLSSRLGEGLLERSEEESPARPNKPEVRSAEPTTGGARVEPSPESAAEPVAQDSSAAAPIEEDLEEEACPEALRAQVLERWRDLDHSEPSPEHVLVPQRARAPGRALSPGLLEGVEDEQLHKLEEAGVTTLQAFIAAPELQVCQATGLSFTRVAHLRFLARRLLASEPAAPESAERRSGSLDSAGPFA